MLNCVLGPVLFCWLAWSIYQQVLVQKDFAVQVQALQGVLSLKGLVLMAAAILLMISHWSLEARKWKMLLGETHPITLKEAVKSIFSGIAFSLATPYRLGEFAGRIIHLPGGTRIQGTVFTFVGSFAQLIITLLAGSAAVYLRQDQLRATLLKFRLEHVVDLFLVAAPVICLLCLLLFFWSVKLIPAFTRIPLLRKLPQQLLVLGSMSGRILVQVLLISAARFAIFILQYWILFELFGVSLHFLDVLLQISIMFLWLAFVPLFAWVDLGLRWQFSLLLLEHFSTNKLGISIAITAVWFVNLIVPGMIGAFTFFGLSVKQAELRGNRKI